MNAASFLKLFFRCLLSLIPELDNISFPFVVEFQLLSAPTNMIDSEQSWDLQSSIS